MTPREVSEPWTHRDISLDDHHSPYPAFIPDTPDLRLNKELPPPPMPLVLPATALYGSDDRHSEDFYANTRGWMSTNMDNDSESGGVGEYIIFVDLTSLHGSNEDCWRYGMICFGKSRVTCPVLALLLFNHPHLLFPQHRLPASLHCTTI